MPRNVKKLESEIAQYLKDSTHSGHKDRSIIVRLTSIQWPSGVKVHVVKFGPDVRQGVRSRLPIGSVAVMHPDVGKRLPDGTVSVHEDELRDTAD